MLMRESVYVRWNMKFDLVDGEVRSDIIGNSQALEKTSTKMVSNAYISSWNHAVTNSHFG